MNMGHGNIYGVKNTNDYLNKIKSLNHEGNIFVASDNNESIFKLEREFGSKVVYVKDMLRGKNEDENTSFLQLSKTLQKTLIIQAFIEMLLLAKCGLLLGTSSNLTNASIIHGNHNKIIRI